MNKEELWLIKIRSSLTSGNKKTLDYILPPKNFKSLTQVSKLFIVT
jgi:hypothetical protein